MILSIILMLVGIIFIIIGYLLIIDMDLGGLDELGFTLLFIGLILGFISFSGISHYNNTKKVDKIADVYIEEISKEGCLTSDIYLKIKKDLIDNKIKHYSITNNLYGRDNKKVDLEIKIYDGFFSSVSYKISDNKMEAIGNE